MFFLTGGGYSSAATADVNVKEILVSVHIPPIGLTERQNELNVSRASILPLVAGARTLRGYWDDPVNLVKPGHAELIFIAYFD